MSAPVTHTEIMGPDRAALVEFYGAVFGWSFEPYDAMNYTIFRTGKGGIGGGIGTPQNGGPSVSVYAEVHDLDAKLKEALDLGASNTMGPIDIGGGRIGTVTDPGGNVFGLYEGTGDEPTPPEGTGAPVVWFDILAKDAEANVTFYTSLLGWQIDRGADGYAHVRAEGSGIGGGISGPMPGFPDNALLVYIDSKDIEADLDKVVAAGGTKVSDRIHVNDEGLDIALFKDPARNLNGLVQTG